MIQQSNTRIKCLCSTVWRRWIYKDSCPSFSMPANSNIGFNFSDFPLHSKSNLTISKPKLVSDMKAAPMTNWKNIVPLIKSRAETKMLKWVLNLNIPALPTLQDAELPIHLLTFLWKWTASMSDCFICTSVILFTSGNVVRKCRVHALKYSPMAKKKLATVTWTNEYTLAIVIWMENRQIHPTKVSSLKGVLQSSQRLCQFAQWLFRENVTLFSVAEINVLARYARLECIQCKRRTLPWRLPLVRSMER